MTPSPASQSLYSHTKASQPLHLAKFLPSNTFAYFLLPVDITFLLRSALLQLDQIGFSGG